MEAHLSQLQDIVRLTIRQELEWSERRLKRVVMSHDASDNPAELYGADGKIYYRKAGGAGGEIGVASGTSLWQSSGSVTELITPEPVLLEDDLTLYDGTSLSPEVELKAYTVESTEGAYLVASTGYFWINRISDDSILARCELSSQKWRLQGELDMTYSDVIGVKVLKGYSTFDLSFWDTATGTKTLSQLAAGYTHPSARQCTTGTWAWASISGKPSFNYLPLAGGTMVGVLNMGGYVLRGSTALDGGLTLVGTSGGGTGYIQCNDELKMASNKITGLAAGTVAGDAVRYEQLAAYLPLAGGTMVGAIDMRDPSSGVCYNVANVGAVIGSADLELGCNYYTTPVNVVTLSSTAVTLHKLLDMNSNKIKDMKNWVATALSGTRKDIEIDIGGVSYYFTVYPTKA